MAPPFAYNLFKDIVLKNFSIRQNKFQEPIKMWEERWSMKWKVEQRWRRGGEEVKKKRWLNKSKRRNRGGEEVEKRWKRKGGWKKSKRRKRGGEKVEKRRKRKGGSKRVKGGTAVEKKRWLKVNDNHEYWRRKRWSKPLFKVIFYSKYMCFWSGPLEHNIAFFWWNH